ncbi:MAG: IS3 family transposase [Acidobacteriota bacterium]
MSARRDVAFVMAECGLSERQASKLLEVDRSSVGYEARPDRNGELRKRLVVLAQQKPRYGYRRLWVLLRREGRGVNLKRVYRLYREARLGVRLVVRKRLKRPCAGGGAVASGERRMGAGFLERRGGSPAGGSGF